MTVISHIKAQLSRHWKPGISLMVAVGVIGVTLGSVWPDPRPSGKIGYQTAQGQLAGPASILQDAEAAGGQTVQFQASASSSAGFTHPGIMVDKSQLDFVKNQLAAGAAPWTAGKAKFYSRYLNANYVPAAVTTIDCTASSTGCAKLMDDSIAAYTQALLYSYSTEPDRGKYAKSAINIMNAWSSKLRSYNGNQARLQLAWSAEMFPRAAEIIRYSYTPPAGDPAFNVADFTTMLNTTHRAAIIAGDGISNGNWELSMADGLINIGVFNDDRATFDAGVAMWRGRVPAYIYMNGDDGGSGLPNRPPPGDRYADPSYLKCYWLGGMSYINNCNVPGFAYTHGMTQETCRDLSHASMGLLALTNGAETARLQGVDLYGEQQARITAAYEFHGAYINTYLTTGSYPALPCGGKPGQVWSPSADGTGGNGYQYGWEIAYNHYANRQGLAMPSSKVMVDRFRPIGAANGAAWETLTHAGIELPPACAQPDARLGTTVVTVNVPADGTYRLWTRVKAPGSDPAAWAVQVDNGCAMNFTSTGAVAGAWTWLDYKDGNPQAKADLALTAGQHTILLTGRTAGLAIDNLSLKDDLTCTPMNADGDCPAAAPPPTPSPNPDTTAPVVSLTAPTTGTMLTGTATFTADASDDTAIATVQFLVDGAVAGSSTQAPYTAELDTTSLPNGDHIFVVRATDTAGNITTTEPLTLSVQNPDTTPPTAPYGLFSYVGTDDSLELTWYASTDDRGVDHYVVYRDGVVIGTTTTLSFTDTGLADGVTYVYKVTAVDAAGNVSPASAELSAATLDESAPTVPTSLSATAPTETTAQLTWTAATDNVGVVRYRIFRGGTEVGTTTELQYADSGLSAATAYSYTVYAEDQAGNRSAASEPVTVTTPDQTAPATPTGLQVIITDTSVNLSWTAPADNVGVTGYRVYRGAGQIGAPTSASLADTGLTNGTTYVYTVVALDAAGNASPASAGLSVTTLDSTAPTAPSGLTATAPTETTVSLAWQAATDNVGVARYLVFRGATQIATTSNRSYTDTGRTAATSYSYTVYAEDEAGNRSAVSNSANVTTPDTTAPAAPTNLQAAAVSQTNVNLTWTAPADNVGVTQYRVFRGATQIGTTTSPSYTDTGRSAATTYSYTVSALDAAGNVSPASASASVTMPDTTAPVTPTTLTPTITAFGQVSLSWTATTDNVGVTAYRLSRGATQLAQSTALSYSDSGLAPNTAYTYSLVALDAAGNVSATKTATITTPTDLAPYGTGWAGAYFAGTGLTGPAIGRLDSTVDFSWGTTAPMPGIPADNYSVRWTGQLKPTATGSYTFYTTGDDGIRVWLNDTLIIDKWNSNTAGTSSARSLTANTLYNLRVEYQEKTGNATAKLQWSGPSIAKTTIPASVMTSGSAGLTASYFSNATLANYPALVKLDNLVNNTWSGVPIAPLPADNFSVRWTGKVKPVLTGTHTFYTDSDDGVRLWVNGQLLINNWTDHGVTTNQATISLTAGTWYDIKMEYYDRSANATAKLSWSYTGLVKTIIPSSALRDR